MSVLTFQQKKDAGKKISMITCYDYSSAKIIADTDIDAILVGDSVAMTIYGYKDTISATLPMMSAHTEAVARGAANKFIVADLPFLSYRQTLSDNIHAVQVLMRSGAKAIKLEGAAGNLELIKHLTESGVPVMGHIGLTPQFVNAFGGYRVQGKTAESACQLYEDALQLQEAGCFALVLECVPAELAAKITKAVAIPTIGIGAGAKTDGQVLVYQDLLGINTEFKPKFVKHFIAGYEKIKNAVNEYINEINNEDFPRDEHCYKSE